MAHFLIVVGIRWLEFLFFAGLVGSALVVILSGIEDVGEAFDKEAQVEPTLRRRGGPLHTTRDVEV